MTEDRSIKNNNWILPVNKGINVPVCHSNSSRTRSGISVVLQRLDPAAAYREQHSGECLLKNEQPICHTLLKVTL